MRWRYSSSERIVREQCVNPFTGKYLLCLSASPVSSATNAAEGGESSLGSVQYEDETLSEAVNRVRYVSVFTAKQPGDEELREMILQLQREYDSSDDVNVFYVDGSRCWLDKSTRVGLFSVLNIEKGSGQETSTIWFGSTPMEMSIEKALNVLSTVEQYAKKCFENTQIKLNEIRMLESREEMLSYDVTSGYPELLHFVTEGKEAGVC